jgi:3-mercaptopyruvate sulfurtransferase SseA
MLPNSDYWTQMLWSFGIENDDHILFMTLATFIVHVDYGFLLNTLGHQKFRVLDGGMKKW